MIGHEIANLVLKKIQVTESFSYSSTNKPFAKDTVKNFLVDEVEVHEYEIENNYNFSLEVSSSSYSHALISDYYFCNERIKQQKESIEHLIQAKSQVAWILVSVYYCSFFLANEISKLYGSFIVNFSREDMEYILSNSQYDKPHEFNEKIDDYNNSYKLQVSQSAYDGFVKLNFSKSSPKPHQAVWKNLEAVLKNLNLNDSLLHHNNLLKEILSHEQKGWDAPNKIRNDWNYKYASYYSDKGDTLGDQFLKILKDSNSAFSWGGNRRLYPHPENNVASIAYIYHILLEAHGRINYRLGL